MATLLPKSHITPNLSVFVAAALGLSALSVVAEGLCYSICYRSGQPGCLARDVFCTRLGVLLFPSEWPAFCGNRKRCGVRASSSVGLSNDPADVPAVLYLPELYSTFLYSYKTFKFECFLCIQRLLYYRSREVK